MSTPMPRITESLVRRSKPKAQKYEITCSAMRGFVLRVLPSGRKVYYVRFRRNGKDVRERIGPVENMSLDDARARAQLILLQSLTGLSGLSAVPPPRAAQPDDYDDYEDEDDYEPRPRKRRRQARARRSDVPVLKVFSTRYLSDHVDRRLKPGTQLKYRDHMKHLVAAFGDVPMDEITIERVENWHASMRDRPSAANNALRVLSHMFTKACDWRVLDRDHRNPVRGVRMFRENRRERFLSPQERDELEEVLRLGEATTAGREGAIRWATAAAIRLLALTGMRRSEVLNLEWSHVDYRHKCFRLPDSKTGQKTVPIGSPVIELLKSLEHRRKPYCPYVVYSCTGGKIHEAALGRSWRTIRKRAGLDDVRLHDLRHSAASDALMSGVPLAVVGKILGHANPSTTARYAHISDSVLADAVEAMSTTIAARRPVQRKPARAPRPRGRKSK